MNLRTFSSKCMVVSLDSWFKRNDMNLLWSFSSEFLFSTSFSFCPWILYCDQEGVEEEVATTQSLLGAILALGITVWEFEKEATVSLSDRGAMASIDLPLDRRKETLTSNYQEMEKVFQSHHSSFSKAKVLVLASSARHTHLTLKNNLSQFKPFVYGNMNCIIFFPLGFLIQEHFMKLTVLPVVRSIDIHCYKHTVLDIIKFRLTHQQSLLSCRFDVTVQLLLCNANLFRHIYYLFRIGHAIEDFIEINNFKLISDSKTTNFQQVIIIQCLCLFHT